MSERFHPDPDSLTALLEGALPEHERVQCLAHLADCPRCREIVYTAQEPQPGPATPRPRLNWRHWFRPIPVLAAAGLACALLIAVTLSFHKTPAPPPRDLVAHADQAVPPAPSPARVETAVQPVAKAAPVRHRPFTIARGRPAPAPISLPEPPALGPSAPLDVPHLLVASLATPPKPLPPSGGGLGIEGTVTDAAGAVIPGATVTARLAGGTGSAHTMTDGGGHYRLGVVSAGRYDLQITAPGFKRESQQLDLAPSLVTIANAQLAVGAVAETVEVSAASPILNTRANAATENPALAIQAEIGKLSVAVDTAGGLLLSSNQGKTWVTVKTPWRGKVVGLRTLSAPTASFEITIDSGSVWVSRDGRHWSATPPQH